MYLIPEPLKQTQGHCGRKALCASFDTETDETGKTKPASSENIVALFPVFVNVRTFVGFAYRFLAPVDARAEIVSALILNLSTV